MVENAYPRMDNHGTKDNSKVKIPYVAMPLPQFLPKIYIMGDRGSTVPQLATSDLLIKMYGDDIINSDSKFYKHTNILFPAVYGNGGFGMVHRLVDETVANTKANIVLYMDILEDDIPVYKRHSDGSYDYDTNGDLVVDPDHTSFKGYRVKWIAEVTDGTEDLGLKSIKTGTMKDANNNPSSMYPIIEFKASDPGSFYNNIGIALDAFDTTKISKSQLEDYKTFPLMISLYKRMDKYSTPTVFRTINDAPVVKFAFKPGVKDPITRKKLELKGIVSEYYNDWDYKEFEPPYVYNNYVETVLGLLYGKEAQWRNVTVNTDTWYDFLPDIDADDEKWLLNPMTFRTLSRVPYYGFMHDTSSVTLASNQSDVTLSKNLPVFLGGGVDGDISDTKFEELVKLEMEKYLDVNGPYYDPAVNVESALVDTGFTFDAKKSLVDFITVRKDTFLFLSTYTFNKDNKPMTLEEERAIGIALNNRCQLAIESNYFNTPVMRAVIVSGSGKYLKDVNNNRYPLTVSLIEKTTKMMGRPEWDISELFDRGELDRIDSMVGIEPDRIPETVRQAMWGINLVYPQAIDRQTYVFPAIQTVYPYDNSVLNNMFTVMAIVYIYKVAYEAQRRFSGNVSMADAEFLAKVDAFINGKLANAFAGMFNVISTSTLTDYDKATGYSWTTNVRIESTVMKTVMQFSVGAYRK